MKRVLLALLLAGAGYLVASQTGWDMTMLVMAGAVLGWFIGHAGGGGGEAGGAAGPGFTTHAGGGSEGSGDSNA